MFMQKNFCFTLHSLAVNLHHSVSCQPCYCVPVTALQSQTDLLLPDKSWYQMNIQETPMKNHQNKPHDEPSSK